MAGQAAAPFWGVPPPRAAMMAGGAASMVGPGGRGDGGGLGPGCEGESEGLGELRRALGRLWGILTSGLEHLALWLFLQPRGCICRQCHQNDDSSKAHYSSRDLPSHTKIKYRQTTQDAPEEVRNRDFRRELEERERVAAREKNRDRPTREHTTSSSVSKKPRLDQIPAANLDADDPLTDEDDEDEDLEDSDDDDTAALLAELEKIKKERAEEQARKEQEQKAEEERIRMENILSGNPLLNLTGPAQPQANFKVKRRWDDDVVFKNCAKGIDESKKDKRFVNDTLRSEFHKKFMEKYIK
ncbi:Protein CWC15-like protein A [Aix galericulata]|nr:Protein CWC15-like protein A [Aix galericulata]